MAVIAIFSPSMSAAIWRSSLAHTALVYTEYWYALVVLLAFLSVATAQTILIARKATRGAPRGPDGKPLPAAHRKQNQDDASQLHIGPRVGRTARLSFCFITAVVVLTFAVNIVALVLHAFVYDDPKKWASEQYWWWCGESEIVYFAGGIFLYFYFLLTLIESKQSPTVSQFVAWLFSLVGELTVILCTFRRASNCQHIDPNSPTDETNSCVSPWDWLDIMVYTVRSCLVFGLCVLFLALWLGATVSVSSADKDDTQPLARDSDESTPLLGDGQRSHLSVGAKPRRESSNDRPADAQESPCQYKEENVGFYRSKKLAKKSTWEYFSGFSVFLPYLWPMHSILLQFIVLVSFVLLVAQRIVNIMVPMQVGVVTQMLLSDPANFQFHQLLLLGVFWGLQGTGGLLASLRSLLWIQVSQHSYRALATAAFEHVHSLSLDFHLGKRTGELLSAMNKGSAINEFLEQFTFNVFPLLADLLIAVYFFWFCFGSTFAVLIGINTFWYLYLTIRLGQTRAERKRDLSNADREEQAVKNDSITSYETVKYFNAEDYEFGRYRDAIDVFQKAEAEVSRGNSRMIIIQSLVYNSGRVLAALLGAWQVSMGTMNVGEFSTLLAYLAQLQSPLNVFGNFYRQVQQSMIHGERLLEIFKIQPTVVDAPNVKELNKCDGHIRWSNVSFAYENRNPALINVNFECQPGKMTAFVGESGGGKSTIFRLLFRYYNSSDGRIEFDGTDVKDLSIASVRRFIGVVPQDTTLFNDTLMFNLRYANRSATDEDVYNACRAASIHDRIMTFPERYNTRVGERGLRLSGGEKQRVAIARTILKNPKIIMLDEATSALDTNTEQQIQERLGTLSAGRTLLVIAHRLSTITHADQIIVMHAGSIAEKGTHEELLAKKGYYSQMWAKQIRAERAAEEARVANRKAHKLMRQANIVAKNLGCANAGSSKDNKDGTGQEVVSSSASSDGEENYGKRDMISSYTSSDTEGNHRGANHHEENRHLNHVVDQGDKPS